MLKKTGRFFNSSFGVTKPKVTDLQLRIDQLEKNYARLVQQQKAQAARGGVKAPAVEEAMAPLDALEAKHFTELYEFSSRQPVKRQPIRRLRLIDNPTDLRTQAIFISREVTIRLAHGAAELAHAPFGFSQMSSIKKLRHFHELSYLDMTKVTALNFAEESNIVELCRTLQRIYQRHHTTTELLASGMRQFVQRNQLDHQLSDLQSSLDDYAEFQAFMDSVLSSRVKIRFTIEHFIECSRRVLPAVDAAASRGWDFDQQEWSDKHVAPRFAGLDPSSFVGSISKAMNMATVAQLAIENAKKAMSDGGAVRSPEVLLTVHGDPNFTFPFPPRQAFNVITSMVAHSMKQEMLLAAQEMRIHSGKMNPVTVLVSQCESNHDAVVRITDRGGGIKVGELESVTTCLYSVRKLDSLAFAEKDVDLKGWMKSAIRVPYACVLARVFGGDLTVASVDGDSTSTCFYAPTSGLDDVLI